MFLSTRLDVDEVFKLFDRMGIKQSCENASTAII